MKLRQSLSIALFLLSIPGANFLVANVGVYCDGPCLLPVWPGIMAPSGVLLAGLALVLRDWVHEETGPMGALSAIGAGAVLSLFVGPPSLAIASAAAFLLSELADLTVYANLRRRGLEIAVLVSSVLGALVDSIAFLLIAFGSLQYLLGQMIGKGEMVVLVVLCLAAWKAWRARRRDAGAYADFDRP